MIVVLDMLNNDIKLIRNDLKKPELNYFYSRSFDYSLATFDNKLRAISEFLATEEAKKLNEDKSNTLILTDDTLGFGLFELPPNLNNRKLRDVFTTRFRLCFSNPQDYYYDSFELDRNDTAVTYFYEFAKRDSVNRITSLFRNVGISINVINEFAYLFPDPINNNSKYPYATLVIGEYDSELIITKNDKVLSVNQFGYGSKVLLNGNDYLDSAYNFNNDEALSFAGFTKTHIMTNEPLTDDNILITKPEVGLTINRPRELRLLKDEQLEQYVIKSNFRKYYARIMEVVEFFVKAPWYFPMNDINVVASAEVISLLVEASKEENRVHFVDMVTSIDEISKKGVPHNVMFNQVYKGEKVRRKIDWRKFLTMEIGGKKKKA